jgi:hypothetical protein
MLNSANSTQLRYSDFSMTAGKRVFTEAAGIRAASVFLHAPANGISDGVVGVRRLR